MYVLGMMATMTQSIEVSVAKQLVIAFGKKLVEQTQEQEDAEEVLIHLHTYIHTYRYIAVLFRSNKRPYFT